MNRARNRPLPQEKLSRRQAYREPRRRLLVVCGGKETEPAYVNGLRQQLRNPAVRVEVTAIGRSPSQVVEYGVKQVRRAADTYDELWCVVDVDQFSDLPKAAALTRKSPVPTTVIVSNPCFELWLLLHFADQRNPLACYADVKPLLCKHVPDYEKNTLLFATYWPRIGGAVDRAKRLEPDGTDHRVNPSTNMWRLVEAMSS